MPHATVSERQRNRAKQLRRTMRPAETLLWRYLKADRIDGLDDESHEFEERQRADQHRDAFFKSESFHVLRFTNEQVTSNLEGVVEVIRQVASSRASASPPSLTLPHKGGGNGRNRSSNNVNISTTRGSQP
jgi:very-short-patch-repair endonuclease